MDWARDNATLTEEDLNNVFRYAPRESTIVRLLNSTRWQSEISIYKEGKAWNSWTQNDLPRIESNDSGLVLILAKRSGEPSLGALKKVTTDDWLQHTSKSKDWEAKLHKESTFEILREKPPLENAETNLRSASGRRGVRTLPFSRNTFENITRKFHIHGSIARVISRADVPVFTFDKVNMSQPAYVCNSRTSNAWDMDLALSLTHFPSKSLTFAIVFGCTSSTERDIITRLATVGSGVSHPLLLPGILAEIERMRHAKLVDNIVDQVENNILELDVQMNDLDGPRGEEAERKARAKRSAYLDIAYLRNGLVSWDNQLTRMLQQCRSLSQEYSTSGLNPVMAQRSRQGLQAYWKKEISEFRDQLIIVNRGRTKGKLPFRHKSIPVYITQQTGADTVFKRDLKRIGEKIERRIISLQDEYEDKIRDCAMRVDGMAMATQWAHGETNLGIAMATNKDSRHMRSVALVTMIFLPGTFFASMFSMTFFDWSGENGSPTVSGWVWIYFLFTVVFTALTVGLWHYIVIFRSSEQSSKTDEKQFKSKMAATMGGKPSSLSFWEWLKRFKCNSSKKNLSLQLLPGESNATNNQSYHMELPATFMRYPLSQPISDRSKPTTPPLPHYHPTFSAFPPSMSGICVTAPSTGHPPFAELSNTEIQVPGRCYV